MMEGVTKRFGAVLANDAVDLTLRRGEVVALLGENGAGKTTLMNVLFGKYAADAGRVLVAGPDGALRPLPPASPAAALRAGIAMVHQHFTLAENLSALDNITLGRQSLWSPRRVRVRGAIERLMAETGLAVPLDARVDALSVGERQRVEILKALHARARILVLDEPTAVFTPQEADRLFETLRALTARGLSVVLISHKMREVMGAAARVVVLRHGRLVGEVEVDRTSPADLARMMMGHDLAEAPRGMGEGPLPGDGTAHDGRSDPVPREAALELARVSLRHGGSALHHASLAVRPGEIVGIAGVSGNGQGALAALVAGLAVPDEGEARIGGEPITRAAPRSATGRGIARIPEDRNADGVVGAMTVAENLVLEHLASPAVSKRGLLRPSSIRSNAERLIEAFDVRCPGPDAPARLLSGGNVQKLVLARTLGGVGRDMEGAGEAEGGPRLVLADQPTRGLDVGAASEVHRRLREVAAGAHGRAPAGVVLISEDLDELLAVSTRIVVAHDGHLREAGRTHEADRARIGLMMAGGTPESINAPEGTEGDVAA